MFEQLQTEEEVEEQEDLYDWIIENTPDTQSNRGATARECTDKFGRLSIERVSNVMSRMRSMGVLSRRKNADRDYEHFRLMGIQEAKITVLRDRLASSKRAQDRMKQSASRHSLQIAAIAKKADPACVLVLCSCGKLNKIHLTARGIEDE